MSTGLLHLHTILRWVVLILLLWSIFKAFQGNMNSVAKDKKLFSMTMMILHLQILIGIGLFIISPYMEEIFARENIMKSPEARFWAIEHLVGMLIGAALITIGHSKFKRKKDSISKYKGIKIFYTLGLLIILASIPWPFRGEGIGRALLPFLN